MTWFGNFYRSAIGKKAVMAVTGVILFGFVLIHMLGNLKVYFPKHESAKDPTVMVWPLNEYGAFLREVGAPLVPHESLLWVARLILLAAVVLHIWAAYQVTMMSRAARPIAYHGRQFVEASYASRTMRWGGVILLLFIIYHILHFTTGQAHPDFIHGDPYHNFVVGFRVWWVSAFYILANLALGLHLYHGVWSMFNSLGLNHPKFNAWKRTFATAFAVIITVGNVSFPLAVLIGIVR
ncbi:MAG TPA: succinate dehydrogenase cytochrome b subunit [Thermoanaerobaculia bacterium]